MGLAGLDVSDGCPLGPAARCQEHSDITLEPDGTVSISSEKYINDIIERFGVQHTKATPLKTGVNPTKIEGEADEDVKQQYQEMTGCISHLANTARVDIAFAGSTLGQVCHRPNKEHVALANHTLQYLNGTRERGISFTAQDDATRNRIECYVDASYADSHNFKSQTGFVIMCNGGPISWTSRTQRFVTTSSQEAEVVAAADAVKEIAFLRALLNSWDCPAWPCKIDKEHPVVCHEDNQGCISWFENGLMSARTKHYGVRLNYIRDQYIAHNIVWRYIHTKDQIADLLTKSLARAGQEKHTDKIIPSRFKEIVHVLTTRCSSSQRPWWA